MGPSRAARHRNAFHAIGNERYLSATADHGRTSQADPFFTVGRALDLRR